MKIVFVGWALSPCGLTRYVLAKAFLVFVVSVVVVVAFVVFVVSASVAVASVFVGTTAVVAVFVVLKSFRDFVLYFYHQTFRFFSCNLIL